MKTKQIVHLLLSGFKGGGKRAWTPKGLGWSGNCHGKKGEFLI